MAGPDPPLAFESEAAASVAQRVSCCGNCCSVGRADAQSACCSEHVSCTVATGSQRGGRRSKSALDLEFWAAARNHAQQTVRVKLPATASGGRGAAVGIERALTAVSSHSKRWRPAMVETFASTAWASASAGTGCGISLCNGTAIGIATGCWADAQVRTASGAHKGAGRDAVSR